MKSPTKLVIGSGGPKGIAITGALQFYYEQGYLTTINEYWGTSVGSIITFLLLIGFTPYEIFYKFFKHSTFAEGLLGGFSHLETISQVGLCPIELLGDKLKQFTGEKIKNVDITFKELYDIFPKKLNIIATNVDLAECVIFNVTNFPDLKVIEAIEISSDIPFLFTRKVFNGCKYTDGGLINEFPVDLASKDLTPDDFILGIHSPESTENANWFFQLVSVPIKEVYRRRLSEVTKESKILELKIEHKGITEFFPDKKTKTRLFSLGYKTAQDNLIEDVLQEENGWEF